MKASRRYEHLREDERTAVRKVRDQLANENSFPECEPGTAIAEIVRVFSRYELWAFSPTDPSVQRAILDANPNETLYKSVRRAARSLLFDLAFELVCGPGVSNKEDNLESAKARSRLITDPATLRYDPMVVDYLVGKLLSTQFRKFLDKLSDDLYNARRRSVLLPVDEHTLVMARHWVNPHCPLWMMTIPVLMKVLPRLTEGVSWTRETIRKRLKILVEAEVRRFPKQPIFEVELRPLPESRPDADDNSKSDLFMRDEFQSASEAAKESELHASLDTLGETKTEQKLYYNRFSGIVIRQFSVRGIDPCGLVPSFDYSIKFVPQRRRTG